MAHEDIGPRSEKHIPGCLAHHVNTYVEGDTCSYRWHAAKRAAAESRLIYTEDAADGGHELFEVSETVERLRQWQNDIGALAKVAQSKPAVAMSKPFSTVWWPWKNQAHPLIPQAVLIQALEFVAASADPVSDRMFDVMVNGLLAEGYNINDEPNVIMLPLDHDKAVEMGLPRNLDGSASGAFEHPDYAIEVAAVVNAKLAPKYQGLAAALKAQVHTTDEAAPVLGPVLEGISIATYEAIMVATAGFRAEALAAAQEAAPPLPADPSLDSIPTTMFG